ncbi:hypothetical protein JOE21_002866 [Desmospora profundinema]|uniref:Uncharacterized protein n=1 Tax=Desmospora profundinema TaxID=1571184 RepID=A0ABU1IPY2_9BACL|nr:hypothetical protein [Desmospora profundinema]
MYFDPYQQNFHSFYPAQLQQQDLSRIVFAHDRRIFSLEKRVNHLERMILRRKSFED